MTSEPDSTGAASAEGAAAVEAAERPEVLEPWSWFDRWFDDWPRWIGQRSPEPFGPAPVTVETIKVEQYVDGDDLVVRAELPGVDPEDGIDVSVTGDRLTISARREERDDGRADADFRSEFHYGSFRRVMRLPKGAAADEISAGYEDGILEVRVPVERSREAPTRVPVRRTSR